MKFNLKKTIHGLTLATLASMSTACSTLYSATVTSIPDGAHRVPVNVVNQDQKARDNKKPTEKKPPEALPQASEVRVNRPDSFVLVADTRAKGQAVKASMLDTLDAIAKATGLKLIDYRLKENDTNILVTIIPNEDPFDVLQQIAKNSPYSISLNRKNGRILIQDNPQSGNTGLTVIKEQDPFIQIGSVVPLQDLPKTPVRMMQAIQMLSPKGFAIGNADNIDTNILVDLKDVKNWQDGLARVALQTPYRIVFDWNEKIVFVIPLVSEKESISYEK